LHASRRRGTIVSMSLLTSTLARLRWLMLLAAGNGPLLAQGWVANAMDAHAPAPFEAGVVSRPDAGVSTPTAPRDAVSPATLHPTSVAASAQPEPRLASCDYLEFHPKIQRTTGNIAERYALQRARSCLKDPTPCNPEELPGLYFGSADLSKERGREVRLEALALERRIAAAVQAQEPEQASQLREKQARLERSAGTFLREAADTFIAALKLPGNPRTDEMLLGLGAVYAFMDKEDLAVEQYQRLIRDFPKSKLVSDAYLAMGEMRFADGDWKGADKFYAIVLKLPPSRVVPCALYKRAWTEYRRGLHARARKSFAACQKIPMSIPGDRQYADQLIAECTRDAKRLGLLRH